MDDREWNTMMRHIHRRRLRAKIVDTFTTVATVAFLFGFLAFALYGPFWQQ